jgi:EAL domain-containing protein (putative c-di-GMP-specific phosphodiesterase class I)
MLIDMPIDALKLDIQFIRSAFKEQKDTRLLDAMIKLAASFEVPTIAEGVETAEQYAELKALGCNVIQGYYFSRPLPADEFEKLMIESLRKEEK